MAEIPRALRVDNQDDGLGQSQFVETVEILPSQFSGTGSRQTATFLLPQTGICDKDGFISFGVVSSNASLRFPLWAGVMSQIETATLWCGGVQLCQSRAVGQKYTMNNFYRDPHNRDHKENMRCGSFLGQRSDSTTSGGTDQAGYYGIDTRQDWCSAPTADTRSITQGYIPTTTGTLTATVQPTPRWRIYLDVLFPFLERNNLPLGLLDDQVKVVLEFQDDDVRGERSVVDGATGWTFANGMSINDPKLHLDLIYYDDPINAPTTMDKIAQSLNSGTVLPFTDDAYVVRQVTAGTAGQRRKVGVLMGLDHQVVRHLTMCSPNAKDYSVDGGGVNTSGNILLGDYCSLGANNFTDANDVLHSQSLQVKINSQPVYPNPLDADGKIYDQLSQVFPTPFKMGCPYTSLNGQTDNAGALVPINQGITDKTLNGHSQRLMSGFAHYYGVPLSKSYSPTLGQGTPIGRQPVIIELEEDCVAGNHQAKTLHIWATCERAMSIKAGKVMVSGS